MRKSLTLVSMTYGSSLQQLTWRVPDALHLDLMGIYVRLILDTTLDYRTLYGTYCMRIICNACSDLDVHVACSSTLGVEKNGQFSDHQSSISKVWSLGGEFIVEATPPKVVLLTAKDLACAQTVSAFPLCFHHIQTCTTGVHMQSIRTVMCMLYVMYTLVLCKGLSLRKVSGGLECLGEKLPLPCSGQSPEQMYQCCFGYFTFLLLCAVDLRNPLCSNSEKTLTAQTMLEEIIL